MKEKVILFLKRIGNLKWYICFPVYCLLLCSFSFSSSFLFLNPFQATTNYISLSINETNTKTGFSLVKSKDTGLLESFYNEYLSLTLVRDSSNIRRYTQGHISKSISIGNDYIVSFQDQILDCDKILSTPSFYSSRSDEFYYNCKALTKYGFYTYNNQFYPCAISKKLADCLCENEQYDSLLAKNIFIEGKGVSAAYAIQCVFDGEDGFCNSQTILVKDGEKDNVFSMVEYDLSIELVKAEKCVSKFISISNKDIDAKILLETGEAKKEIDVVSCLSSFSKSKKSPGVLFLYIITIFVSIIVCATYWASYYLFANKKNSGLFKSILFNFGGITIVFALSFIKVDLFFTGFKVALLTNYTVIPIIIVLASVLTITILKSIRNKHNYEE